LAGEPVSLVIDVRHILQHVESGARQVVVDTHRPGHMSGER